MINDLKKNCDPGGKCMPVQDVNESQKIDRTLKGLFTFLTIFMCGSSLILLISFWIGKNLHEAFTILICFWLISGAYFFGGGIAGFLFAIPRSGLFRYKAGQENNQSWYGDNTNLEDLSDWITKIIVGLSLVQFQKILFLLDRSAKNIAMCFCPAGCEIDKFYALAYGLIIFFIAYGFVIGYLWTRINFAIILTVSRKRLNEITEIQQQKEQALNTLSKIKEEKEKISTEVKQDKAELVKVKDEVTAAISQENVRKGATTSLVEEIDRFPVQRERLLELIDFAKLKPVLVKDDIQKRRWGGKSENNGKKLSATPRSADLGTGYYTLDIKVEKIDPDALLDSPVIIFVHDSFGFPENAILAETNDKGIAVVELVTYEAFTIGALCLDGTELELDLNDVSGFPKEFYWK